MIKKNNKIKEEWIKLENELAEELLRCKEISREGKYTEIYEKMFSVYPEEKRRQMSKNYFKGAIEFNETIKRIIGNNRAVLEIGCGFGHLSYLVAKQGNDVKGIDVNGIHIKEARQNYGGFKNLVFLETGGVKLSFPNSSFDFVISTSVFEHLHPDDVNNHFSEVRRVLRKRGKYIFTAITPYIRRDISVFSRDPEQRKKHGLHINEKTWKEFYDILNKYSFKGMTNILPSKLEKKIPIQSILIPIKAKIYLEKLLINSIIVRLFKLGNVFIVATRV